MEFKKELNIDKAPKPRAYIEFGLPGHETEYVFTTQEDEHCESQELQLGWGKELKSLLGDGWLIMDRGTRIEIVPPNSTRTSETDTKLREAINTATNNKFEFGETT
ncbi:MAG: hypothetical protein UT48_C0008G0038 [Parcubacteria group bacterium GW2011_GWE2_39_37]|uniref:Uncharacterized protein n=1 Tax=Candidatus Falkowbacteria bacterium GW2011_GWF2_39_8 TaxID=1618642 RepID=A0A0G0PXE3_9BACT|nr:MAG: hypothetical protein UT48_C0008G0038 [Parcubacteria group bacterium GW2011_GWE2_39_37]KKR32804.1 MAG: hypothetical protein UT64_C0022G0003 [Candidatus Falkowbacteria bacterium GW2011_GWF2_39_8]